MSERTKKRKRAPRPLRGVQLLRKAVNHILRHPDKWKQSDWTCGSSHCVGGWCEEFGGEHDDKFSSIWSPAKEHLGINQRQADWLFHPHRTSYEIHRFARMWLRGERPAMRKIPNGKGRLKLL